MLHKLRVCPVLLHIVVSFAWFPVETCLFSIQTRSTAMKAEASTQISSIEVVSQNRSNTGMLTVEVLQAHLLAEREETARLRYLVDILKKEMEES